MVAMSAPRPPGGESLPLSRAQRVDAACVRFEAAWQAGQQPAVEAYLGGVREEDRPALLRELLALELAYRRRGGEAPWAEELLGRFPGHADLVHAVFHEASPPPLAATPPATGGGGGPGSPAGGAAPGETPAPPWAERNLLFGILALQMDFVSRDQLLAAMNAWVLDKARPLGQVLRDQGALAAGVYGLLEALVERHLARHGGVRLGCTDRLIRRRGLRRGVVFLSGFVPGC
jgi:hypothetical protein